MVDIPNRFLEKRRHHTVPRFYLKNFTKGGSRRDGMLWRYERGGESPIPIHPNDACVVNDFYRAKDVDGDEHNVVEEYLAKLEDLVAPIIRSVIDDRKPPSAEECARLSMFAASLYFRTTAFRQMYDDYAMSWLEKVVYKEAKDKEAFHARIREFVSQGLELSVDIEELRLWFLNRDNYTVEPNRNTSLRLYFVLFPQLAAKIATMKHTIMDAKGEIEFLTSDNPVAIAGLCGETGKWQSDFESQGTQVSLPLSPQYVFVASWDGPTGFASCNLAFKRNINKRTACRAHRYVFSPFTAQFILQWLNEQEPMIPKLEWSDSVGKGTIRDKN